MVLTTWKKFVFGVSIGLALLLAGGSCNAPTGDTNDQTGTLSVLLADDPFPLDMVDSASVTIDSVVIRSVDEEGGAPFLTLSTAQATFNLLDLRNGVTASLTELEVPAGLYDLIRLYVSQARLVLTDGRGFNVFIPSGEETGIKIFIDPAIEVVGGLSAELLLDLDVSQSFVLQGNLNSPAGVNGFIFKPTLRAANLSTSGRINGTVTDGTNPLGGAHVWVSQQDTVVTSTFTEETEAVGSYALLGLPAGTYTASATLAGYDTVSVDVTVAAGSQSSADFELTPQ